MTELKSERTFTFVLSKEGIKEKPKTQKTYGSFRAFNKNELRTMDIFKLASLIEAGHYFHASCLLASLNQKRTDNGNLTKYYNDTCVDLSNTTLYAVDVDHGNFTLEELKELLEVTPALIYKTFSYDETNKRYRLLFIADRPPKDLDEWERVQKALIYQFMRPFEGENIEKVVGKLDFSYGPSRLSLGSTRECVVEVQDETFNVDEWVLNNEYIHEEFEDLETLWKIELKRREGEVIDEQEWVRQKEKTSLKSKNKPFAFDHETPQEKMERLVLELLASIEQFKQSHAEVIPTEMSITDFEYWMNHHLPLSVLFPRASQFNCLMPHHKDSTPSASYLRHQTQGYEVMHCRGCQMTRSSFQLVAELFKAKFDHNFFETTKMLCRLLGITLGSKWQQEAIDLIRYNLDYVKKLPDEMPFKKQLITSRTLAVYEEMLALALIKLPLKPFTSIEESRLPCFFASYRFINGEMKKKGIKGHSTHNKTAEKINRLVEHGLLIKINYKDLTPEARAETDSYRKTLGYYEVMNSEKGVASKEAIKSSHITFYAIVGLNPTLTESVTELIREKKVKGIRAGETTWSKMATVYGEERANQIMPQSKAARPTKYNQKKSRKEKYSKEEQAFLIEMNQAIESLLEEKGWFTIKELKTRINRRKFNSNQKEAFITRFFNANEVNAPINFNKKINKDLRTRLSIPDNVKKGSIIYYLN